jgi:hypothetical protein
LTAVQALLDTLSHDRNYCVICREQFKAGDVLSIFGCCSLFYHLECASTWLNQPVFDGTGMPISDFVTCMPCTARWDRDTFNEYFAPHELSKGIQTMASGGDVVFIPAGAPPQTSSLVYAATHYGQDGLGLVLAEAMEEPSVQQEELPDRIDELAWQFANPTATYQTEDEGLGGMEDEGVGGMEDEGEEQADGQIEDRVEDQAERLAEEQIGEGSEADVDVEAEGEADGSDLDHAMD